MRQSKLLLLGMCAALAAGAAPVAASGQGFEPVCEGMATEAERAACRTGARAALESRAPAPVSPRRNAGGFLGLGIFGGDGDGGPRDAPATGLGAEEVNFGAGYSTGGETADLVASNVLGVREHVPGILEFELDNGQVWRQTSGGTPRFTAGDAMSVEMWESWAGGYRMRLVDQRQVLRVERIR